MTFVSQIEPKTIDKVTVDEHWTMAMQEVNQLDKK